LEELHRFTLGSLSTGLKLSYHISGIVFEGIFLLRWLRRQSRGGPRSSWNTCSPVCWVPNQVNEVRDTGGWNGMPLCHWSRLFWSSIE